MTSTERERREDATLWALKMEEGAMSQGSKQHLETGRDKVMDSPLEPTDGTWVCQPLDVSQVKLI